MATVALAAGADGRLLRLRFLATIFAGSFLLFLVQPMIGRMALPRLGGAPAVWNSAMLVYQALLLAGYAYAHWLGRFAPRRQAAIHFAGFAIAALMLPLGLSAATPSASANIFLWVPWLLATSIGPLFFIVAAQAPLVQRWFTVAGGGDPYPLYAASNFGSFAGLISYPLLIEPLMPLASQSMLWSAGFVLVALLMAGGALTLPAGAAIAEAATPTGPAPSRRTVGKWIGYAAIPSGLMLSTTLHLSTEIIAMPLLWVVPLGLYLLSFSAAFAERRSVANLCRRIAPFGIIAAAFTVFNDTSSMPWLFASVALASLFIISVALHSELFDRRPEPARLTHFYLVMSVGGVIGGIFCALIAPMLFDWTYEHPLLLAAAGFALAAHPLLPVLKRIGERGRVRIYGPILFYFLSLAGPFGGSETLAWLATMIMVALAIASIGRPLLFAAAIGSLMLAQTGWQRLTLSAQDGRMTRSFFGVYTILPGTDRRTLVHGTTLHGVQLTGSPARERTPTSYYVPRSGVGLAITAAPALFGDDARIDVVGLGAGTLACYARPGQSWAFYEIDPAVVAIARDAKRFTFLSRCLPDAKVEIGDARLTLAASAPASADLLVIDAFSSDAVPMHLLTREAFAVYRRRLQPGGLLMMHISNRYLDLEPVIAAAAREGWTARARHYTPDAVGRSRQEAASIWIALAPHAPTLARLVARQPSAWQKLEDRGFLAWTDDHASVLPIIRR